MMLIKNLSANWLNKPGRTTLLALLSHAGRCVAQEHQSLMRDVQKFLEEQQKRQRSIKESEASTQEVVHAFQVWPYFLRHPYSFWVFLLHHFAILP
ncbi:unnamed protein product [Dicrocoelium dendriticum]|nr:unnamed protein product [Dicrocoelium dendriticum]